MRNVLLLDTETTGMDPEKDGARCIEVAVQLFDIQLATPIMSFASLMWDPSWGEPANPQEKTNGISAAMLAFAPPPLEVWRRVRAIAGCAAECVVAHRAEFDMRFTPPMKRPTAAGPEDPLPWACTKSDFKWPHGLRGDHLVHLALGLGLGVVAAHRAMTDVDIMSRVLSRVAEMGGDLQELFRLALRPKVRVVSLAPFEMKDIVKEHGFFWDPPPVKQWYRWMSPEDRAELPFRTVIDEKAGGR